MSIAPSKECTCSYQKEVVVERMSRSKNQTVVWVLTILIPVYARSCLWSYLKHENP